MPVETLTAPPCSISAGTTVRFTVSFADYPATAWTLAFSLLGSGNLTVTGSPSGSAFLVTLTAAQTAALVPGQYSWSAKVTETAGGDVAIAERGLMNVCPDLSNGATGPARAAFIAATAAMNALAANQYKEIDVEGQSFTTQDIDKLQAVLDRLEDAAIREDALYGRARTGGLKRILSYI